MINFDLPWWIWLICAGIGAGAALFLQLTGRDDA